MRLVTYPRGSSGARLGACSSTGLVVDVERLGASAAAVDCPTTCCRFIDHGAALLPALQRCV